MIEKIRKAVEEGNRKTDYGLIVVFGVVFAILLIILIVGFGQAFVYMQFSWEGVRFFMFFGALAYAFYWLASIGDGE